MSSFLTLFGDATNFKCHLKIVVINIGFVLSVCPSLLKIITNFPDNNKIPLWIE